MTDGVAALQTTRYAVRKRKPYRRYTSPIPRFLLRNHSAASCPRSGSPFFAQAKKRSVSKTYFTSHGVAVLHFFTLPQANLHLLRHVKSLITFVVKEQSAFAVKCSLGTCLGKYKSLWC